MELLASEASGRGGRRACSVPFLAFAVASVDRLATERVSVPMPFRIAVGNSVTHVRRPLADIDRLQIRIR